MSEKPVNYAVRDRDLKYYIFDSDDNILHMPTRIHLERRTDTGEWVPHSVSTAAYSVIRSDTENFRPPNGNWEEAFCDFRDIDVDNENVFLRDTRNAIDKVARGEKPAAPCYMHFKQALIEGRLFAIVTARGHSPDIIQTGVRYFLNTALTDEDRTQMLANLRGYLECYQPGHALDSDEAVLSNYLNLNKYHGVMSSHFQDLMGQKRGSSPDAEAGKQFAVRDFVEHVIRIGRERGLDKPISVGFSDDDVGNVEAVENYIRDALAEQFPNVRFVVYYTSIPEEPTGRKVIVRGQLNLPLE